MDVSQDGRCLALSLFNGKTGDTFIDLFTLQNDENGSKDVSLLRSSQPYISKQMTKIKGLTRLPSRCVCLLDDSVFVTCYGNRIESYDTKHGHLVNRRLFTGTAHCMTTTREGRVYVGLYDGTDVIVFNRRLHQIDQ